MSKKCTIALGISLAVTAGASFAQETPESWYQQGAQEARDNAFAFPNLRTAKNIILFVGDGMGVSTVTAARILDGQEKGGSGEENQLAFEKLPYLALSKTYNTNQQTPDSAGTMTAMMSGIKTKAGIIGVNQNALRGDCETALGNEVETFLEQAEQAGMSTGIVSTARITHATPAATYAHVPERNWEDDSKVADEDEAMGCKDIARQLIEFPYGNGLEVALGGGRRHFLPNTVTDGEGKNGRRTDGRNLTEEWVSKYSNAQYVWNEQQFNDLDTGNTDHLLGLFNSSHMQYEADRANDVGGEPSLADMTSKAIEVLQKNRKGFFLMVEAGRIDHGHHAGNAHRALKDTQALSDAVQAARDLVNSKDTLIIVTADHSHVFTIAGYPTRGNPILGKVVGNDSSGEPLSSPTLAADGMPYTTVGYANGLGFADLDVGGDTRYGEPGAAGSRTDLTSVDTQGQGFHQEALVPLGSETHAAEDVAIYAGGPWAHMFRSTHEQNYIYHVMKNSAKLKLRRFLK